MLGGRLAARLGCCRCLGVVGSAVGAFLATISATIAVPIAMAAFASFVMATATFATMAVRGLAGSSCGGFGGFSGRVCTGQPIDQFLAQAGAFLGLGYKSGWRPHRGRVRKIGRGHRRTQGNN